MWCCGSVQIGHTFWRITTWRVTVSKKNDLLDCLTLKMKELLSFKNQKTAHPRTLYKVPEDLGALSSHKVYSGHFQTVESWKTFFMRFLCRDLVRCQPVTIALWVWSQASLFSMCDGQIDTGPGLTLSISLFLSISFQKCYLLIIYHKHYIILAFDNVK